MDYKLIRSDRKTIAIQIQTDGSVVVRAPKRAPQSMIDAAVQKHELWIEAHKRSVTEAAAQRFVPRIGETAMLFGRALPLAAGRSTVLLEDKLLLRADSPPEVELANFYQRAAKQVFPDLLRALAQKEKLSYRSLTITGAKTRFGSCSGKNGISLSWRLACAPKELIESVMLHELCHTLHHDHSDAFWREVYRRMPDYDRKKQALNEWAHKWFLQ